MKITSEHYAILESAVQATLAQHANVIREYTNRRRLLWDVLWASEKHLPAYWITNTLYPYLNDAHIETALNRIVPK